MTNPLIATLLTLLQVAGILALALVATGIVTACVEHLIRAYYSHKLTFHREVIALETARQQLLDETRYAQGMSRKG